MAIYQDDFRPEIIYDDGYDLGVEDEEEEEDEDYE